MQEDLNDLYEAAPCGFVTMTPTGIIVKVNRTLCSWLGWPPAALVGKSIHTILGFGGKIAFETHLAPLLRLQGHVHEVALDLLTAEGTKLPSIVNAVEKRTEQGDHLLTRLAMIKAVDRRAYERALLDGRLKAEADVRQERENALLREQFIAVLGHDLRNPLAALEAGVEMLERHVLPGDQASHILAEMRGSVDRAEALIEDLLDFARGRLGGGIPADKRPTLLQPIFEQVVGEVQTFAPGQKVRSEIDVPREVVCDGRRLGQLASNLLANAASHSPTGSEIRFKASMDDERLFLSIANDGPPIPDEVRPHLFKPFFRGSVRSSRNGLGLGLFITNEIAKAHAGSLSVSSTPKETCFTFSMPLSPKSEPAEVV